MEYTIYSDNVQNMGDERRLVYVRKREIKFLKCRKKAGNQFRDWLAPEMLSWQTKRATEGAWQMAGHRESSNETKRTMFAM